MHSNGRTFADSNEIASSFDHFLNVFSIMVSPISMKLSDLIQDKICKIQSRDYKDFMFLLVYNFSLKVLKIGYQIFRNGGESPAAVPFHICTSTVSSGRQ